MPIIRSALMGLALALSLAGPGRAELLATLAAIGQARSAWDLVEIGVDAYLDTSGEDRARLAEILSQTDRVVRGQEAAMAELQALAAGLPGAIEAGFIGDDLVTLRALIANVETIVATDPGPAGLEDLRRYAFEVDVLTAKIAERGGAQAASGYAAALTVQGLLHRLIGTEPARVQALAERGGAVLDGWLDPGRPGSLAATEAALTDAYLAAAAPVDRMRLIPLMQPVWQSDTDNQVRTYTLAILWTGARGDLFPAWRGTGNPAEVTPGRDPLAPYALHVVVTFDGARTEPGLWLRNWLSGRLYLWHVLDGADAAEFPCLAPLQAEDWHEEGASADLPLWRAGAPGEMVFAERGLGLLWDPAVTAAPLDPACVIDRFGALMADRDRVQADLFALRTVIADLQAYRAALAG
jgi:hypothetical protein